nr:hypothetical protein [uncultured Draconibacterium sp.]
MKIIKFVFFILCFYNCTAQVSYNDLCKELYQYTEVSGGEVKRIIHNEDYSELFKIEELVSKETTLLKKNGIYQFESTIEDASKGIFIKKDGLFEIHQISNPGFLLPKVMNFLNDTSVAFSDKTKLDYIGRIIEIYEEDFQYKTNIIFEKENGQFKYFF